jgi:hypothetical protein
VDLDIKIQKVDETLYKIKEGFASKEPANLSLARIMEPEIVWVIHEWRTGLHVVPADKLIEVTETEYDLVEYPEEPEFWYYTFHEQEPYFWLANHDSILAWDTLEHGNHNEDQMPAPNIRKKKASIPMAITINGGAMGRGVSIAEYPRCTVDPAVN